MSGQEHFDLPNSELQLRQVVLVQTSGVLEGGIGAVLDCFGEGLHGLVVLELEVLEAEVFEEVGAVLFEEHHTARAPSDNLADDARDKSCEALHNENSDEERTAQDVDHRVGLGEAIFTDAEP